MPAATAERIRALIDAASRQCAAEGRALDLHNVYVNVLVRCGVGRDDAARLVAHRGVLHVGGTLESVEEVRVAVAHDTEDVVDVAGEGLGDVRGDGGHGAPWRRER